MVTRDGIDQQYVARTREQVNMWWREKIDGHYVAKDKKVKQNMAGDKKNRQHVAMGTRCGGLGKIDRQYIGKIWTGIR